jgi:murein peptide amidase A
LPYFLTVAAAALLATGASGCSLSRDDSMPPSEGVRGSALTASVRRAQVLGRSLEGRPIRATEVGDPRSPRRMLVVGCIHGDERAGIAIARTLDHALPRGVDVWVVDNLNPDGAARRTRQNARGVDLNRNFPWRWRVHGSPGDRQYPGRAPLSEPESRIATLLVRKLRPAIGVWFHQALGVVDESGGDVAIERRFARLVHLPLRRLTRYPGSALGWENHVVPRGTAFVVELPAGRVGSVKAQRYSRALVRLATGET